MASMVLQTSLLSIDVETAREEREERGRKEAAMVVMKGKMTMMMEDGKFGLVWFGFGLGLERRREGNGKSSSLVTWLPCATHAHPHRRSHSLLHALTHKRSQS